MCAEMYEAAKELARIGMPRGLTAHEQEEYVFKRIHGISALEMAAKQ